ncbi:MAG: homocysteine S-methyltransferase family protein [SAR324 cluster bacterium]|nr:homocysteine S-methyltransferase family protein [SAR324 cluster bacterium]
MPTDSFTLIDGGMGQELIKKTPRTPTPLWSADVLRDYPELVVETHCDFIKAGSDVITLSSYSVTPTRLAKYNRENEFEILQKVAVEAAQKAAQSFNTKPLIAGCLPPLPGSYRPSERLTEQESYTEYQRITECQFKHVDLFICETMSSVEEACISTTIAKQTGLPVWTSFTVDEDNGELLRSGEPILDGAKAVLAKGASAILINCSPPESITQAVEKLVALGAEIGAMANGFVTTEPLKGNTTVDVLESRLELTPQKYVTFTKDWLSKGAKIIGGCCEIGPKHIAEINKIREASN